MNCICKNIINNMNKSYVKYAQKIDKVRSLQSYFLRVIMTSCNNAMKIMNRSMARGYAAYAYL